MILVGISGKRRSGKSLLARLLVERAAFKELSLAGPLKQMCREHFGLSENQVNGTEKETATQWGPTPRRIMIETGKFYRSINPDFWVDKVETDLLQLPRSGMYVVSDIRFKNEARWVKECGGYLVRLERAVELTGESIDDPSETDLDYYPGFDCRIPESCNVDLADMQTTANTLIEELLCQK